MDFQKPSQILVSQKEAKYRVKLKRAIRNLSGLSNINTLPTNVLEVLYKDAIKNSKKNKFKN